VELALRLGLVAATVAFQCFVFKTMPWSRLAWAVVIYMGHFHIQTQTFELGRSLLRAFPQAKLMIEQYCIHNLQHLTVEAVNPYIIEEVITKMYALWDTGHAQVPPRALGTLTAPPPMLTTRGPGITGRGEAGVVRRTGVGYSPRSQS